MAETILNRDEFRAWLEANTQEIVGYTCCATSCPLATFFQRVKQMTGAEVDGETVQVGINSYSLPPWADEFVSGIDSLVVGHQSQDVWGAQALAVLDAV